MININDFFALVIILIMSIILLWFSTFQVIKRHAIKPFLPILFSTFALCMQGAFIFYGFYYSNQGVIINFILVILLIWYLIVLRRENGSN